MKEHEKVILHRSSRDIGYARFARPSVLLSSNYSTIRISTFFFSFGGVVRPGGWSWSHRQLCGSSDTTSHQEEEERCINHAINANELNALTDWLTRSFILTWLHLPSFNHTFPSVRPCAHYKVLLYCLDINNNSAPDRMISRRRKKENKRPMRRLFIIIHCNNN